MGLSFHTYYSDMVNRRTTVYRLYGRDGALLYVGLSVNVRGRIEKHKRKPWWPDVASMETTDYPDRESAKQAEREAIYHEEPRHNIYRPRLECC